MLWTGVLLLLVMASSLLSIFTLRQVNELSRLTLEDHEVRLNTRQIKDDLTRFIAFSLTWAVTHDANDRDEQDRIRERLKSEITAGLGSGMDQDLVPHFDALKSSIEELLRTEHEQGTVYTSPDFRHRFGETMRLSDVLSQKSDELLAAERDENARFYHDFYRLDVLCSAITVLVVAASLFAMFRYVLNPVQKLYELIRTQRAGNLSARWTGTSKDEIGMIGLSLNRFADEVEERRRERVAFIGSVAHDIKNPLSAISMNCELVLKRRDSLDEAAVMSTIVRIKAQADRLSRLTNELLHAAKEHRASWTLERQSVDLPSLVNETLELFRASRPDRKYELELVSPPPPLQADRDRLSQVLFNLMSNATKYSGAGSPIEVAVGRADGLGGPGSAGAFLEVRDRGVGVPDERKKSIFEPFLRLDSGIKMSEGEGLGLSIVRQMVQAHGGSIEVTDRPGGGSVFRIELPKSA
jgi:signal transduction histidine kinase